MFATKWDLLRYNLDDEIKRAVSRGNNLDYTKKLLEARFETKFVDWECKYIEDCYVDYLKQYWLQETPKLITDQIQQTHFLKCHEEFKRLNTFTDCYNFILGFGFIINKNVKFPSLLYSYVFLLKDLCTTSDKVSLHEKQYVHEFRDECVNLLKYKAHSIKNEYNFFTRLLQLFKSSKNPKEVCQSLCIPSNVQDLENELYFKNFLNILLQNKSQNGDVLKVQQAAKQIIIQDEFIFNKEIVNTICSYLEPTIVKQNKVYERQLLEVFGNHMVVSEVLDDLENKLENNNIEEVHFVANVIHIDKTLSAKIWHGKNIVVFAETAIISDDKAVTWDVSGKDAPPPYDPQAGTRGNGWGLPGADGKDGESGGNVLMRFYELTNGHNFNVTSNGGNGGNGQDGGNGKNGKDGNYLKEHEFKTLFPPASKFFNKEKLKNLNIIKDNIMRNFQSLDECYVGSTKLEPMYKKDFENYLSSQINELTDFYFKLRCDNGYKITYSFYYGPLFTFCQSFLLHEGSPGEEGKPGGVGGKEGVGGFAGDIDIEVNNTLNSNCTLSRVDGKEGMPGRCGMSGIPGKMGADRAHKDFSLGLKWPKYKIPKGNVKLQVVYTEDNSSEKVYTGHNQLYADISERNHEFKVSNAYKSITKESPKKRTMLEKLVQRKKTICEESIKNQYEQKLHEPGLFKFSSLLKNAESYIHDSDLSDETLETQSEHITTEFTTVKTVTYSGQKRVNPRSLTPENDFSCALEKKPNNNLEDSSDEIIKLVKNDPSPHNWIKLLQIRLDLAQLKCLWDAFTKCLNNQSPNDKSIDLLKIGFCNKFQLAALEYFANQFDCHDFVFTSKCNSNNISKPNYTLNSFNKLFTINKKHEPLSSKVDQYILIDNKENRRDVLHQCLDLFENPSGSRETFNAMLSVIINEFPHSDSKLNMLQELHVLRNNKKKKVSTKFDYFKNALRRENHKTIYNDVLEGIVEKNNKSLVMFENEIRKDRYLFTLYKSFVKTAQEQYVGECISKLDKSELHTYLSDCFVDMGPTSFVYREFLAYYHEINIVVYSINDNNKVVIAHNHNSRANSSVHFLQKENKFLPLNVNNDFVEMLNNHYSKCKLFSSTQIYIDSLNTKEMGDFVSKQLSIPDLNNHVCGNKSLTMRIRLTHIFMEDVNIKTILESYHLDGEKKLLSCILEKFKFENTGCSSILYFLALHFENEGNHISAKELIFVLNFVLKCTLNVPHVLPLVSWILSAYSQTQWLVEIILLKLELNLKKTLKPQFKSKLRKYLCVHNQKNVLMLLMEKICEEDLDFNEKKFEETFYLLSKIPQSHLGLDKVHLDEWKYYLKDKFWAHQLKELGDWSVDNLKSASYYLMVLENLVGIETCEKLVEVLKKHKAEFLCDSLTITKLPDVFRNIADREVCLDENLLNILENRIISDWTDVIKQQCFSINKERCLSQLVKIIKNCKNTSEEVRNKLDSIAKSVERCNIVIGTLNSHIKNELELKHFISKIVDEPSDTKKSFIDKLISNLTKISITDQTFNDLGKALIKVYRTQNIKSNQKEGIHFLKNLASDQTYETVFAVVVTAIKLKYGIKLRETQKITIWTMLRSKRNVLCQVATGEGKSLIVVVVAIIKVLLGQQKVDIITSSRVLAMRDAHNYKDFYKLFGIHVGHNCSENIEERKIVYSNNSVVYGELANFQRDFLLDRMHNHNIRGDRQFRTIIVDEVDSMLLDKGNNTLYLSHEIPGLDKLESVFILIWKALHVPAESGQLKFEFIVSELKSKMLHDIFGIVTKEDLKCLDSKLGDKEVNNTWHYMLKEKIIDDSGKVLKQLGDQFKMLPVNCIHEDHLKYLFKKIDDRVKSLKVPNYLKQFVEKHLEAWITSGIRAMTMESGVDYVVDIDRSESSCDRCPNITIVDQDTGTDQVNSQWENGLHQFLQIKHGCRLSLITLKAVFISNVSFLQKYESLYGLTGTLGSKMERELLEEIYNVDYVTIPTAKTKSFKEEVPIVCSNTAEWLDTICREVCKKTDSRSVLIVCETVNDVKFLEKKFNEFSSKKERPYKQIHTYTRDYEELTIGETLEPGHIIISTNLAGRGTDIKLSEDLIEAGGLHVCLSYLPGNSRIEEQAFGRAARNGEPGSGQMIVNSYANNNVLKIIHLKYQRDMNELLRITDIKDYHNSHIKLEEKCFDEFQNVYQLIGQSEHPGDIKSILLQTTLDQWAFWLEDNSNCLNVKNVKGFLEEIRMLKETEFSVWSQNVKDPFQLIKLGLILIEKGQYISSILLFERVIKEEPFFSESAYYYRLMAKSKIEDISSKEVIVDDLKFVSMQLKERMKNSHLQAYTVDYLKTKRLKAVLQIESFKEQQLNIAEIYNVFLQSIYKLVGYEIGIEEFQLPDVMDEESASRVFSDLVRENVIKKPTFKKDISDTDFPFAVKYGIDPKEISSFYKNYEGQIFNEIDHLEKLKTEFCLPSRELFWSVLVSKNILTNIKQYCIVDLHKLKHVDPSLINYIETLKEINTKQRNEIWMYHPEEIDCAEDKQILLRRELLAEEIGEHKYTFLLNKSIIYLNSLATLTQPDNDVEFDNFDCLRDIDFLKVGISKYIALSIIEELNEKRIIEKKKEVEGYMLLINYNDIKYIELSTFKGYSDDVIKLLNVRFAFRIALTKICELKAHQRENNDALSLPLPIRIHHNIIRDLFEYRIVSKHVINPEKNVSKILPVLYPKAMTKEEWCRLFDGLYDSNTSNEIINDLISHNFLQEKLFTCKYVIDPENGMQNVNGSNAPHLECKKDTVKLVIERQRILGTENSLKRIEQLIKDYSSTLYEIDTPAFYSQSLSKVLLQQNLTLSELKIFSLNGFDKILVLEEKKFTMNMMIKTSAVALAGVAQIAVGVYMQLLLLQPLGYALITEGISDIVYAVTCCFSGHCSLREFTISKIISLIVNGICILKPLQKLKSMFGQSLAAPSILSSQKSECTSILGKASNFIKTIFKTSPTQPTINKTVIVKTLAKQVITHSALGCTIGITHGVIDNYLQPEFVKLGDDLVERCSVDIHEVASQKLMENIKEIYLLLGPKEAQRFIRMCYSSVVKECRINSKNDWKTLFRRLCTIVDKESLSCFQELRNEVTIVNVGVLLGKLLIIMTKLREAIDSCSSMFSGHSIVSKFVNNIDQNLENNLKELRKTQSKASVDDCKTETFADEILSDLQKELKSILVENIQNNIIDPLLSLVNTTCVKFLSNMAAEKCVSLLKEEDVMELMKYNDEMYKKMEFEQDMKFEQNTFYHREYNDYLLEVLKRKKSTPVFREILENNYSIGTVCIELCCSVIPMALKQEGLNVPMLRLIVDNNGVRSVYGGSNESDNEVLTITIADNIESNLKENKILLKILFDSVCRSISECYPEYKWLTSGILHTIVIKAIKNNFDMENLFRNFDNENDDKTYFQKLESKAQMDTVEDESSSHLWSRTDREQSACSGSEIKVVQNTKDMKMYLIKSFKAALAKINSHLYQTQPYLKSFKLTLEDFIETGHLIIPSHKNIPGRFFDYYATGYELVIPLFGHPKSGLYADYIVTMTLNCKKHLHLHYLVEPVDFNSETCSRLHYSVEPVDQRGRLDWGMKGSILLDAEFGDNVYTVKDCHSAGELILPGFHYTSSQNDKVEVLILEDSILLNAECEDNVNTVKDCHSAGELVLPGFQCTSSQNDKVEVLIFGDSMFRFISDYIPKVKFVTKHFPDNAPSTCKSEIITFVQEYSKAQCVVLYFGNYAVKSEVYASNFVRYVTDLVTHIKLKMNNVKIILCEVLYPRLGFKFGYNKIKVKNEKVNKINKDLNMYCNRENVIFLRTNSFVRENHFGRDGLHLNRRGYYNISNAIVDQIGTII